jgi:dolichyldiphosphatase
LDFEAHYQGGETKTYVLFALAYDLEGNCADRGIEIHGKGYGMPSSHAQFVAFFSIYLTLFLLVRHQPHPTNTHTPLSFTHRLLLSVAAVISAAGVAVSRVYLSYHTPKQVLAGCLAGAIIAIGWFIATTIFRKTGGLEWLLDTEVARHFRMRDLVVTEDLMDAGWARWEERRKKRSPRSNGKKKR